MLGERDTALHKAQDYTFYRKSDGTGVFITNTVSRDRDAVALWNNQPGKSIGAFNTKKDANLEAFIEQQRLLGSRIHYAVLPINHV